MLCLIETAWPGFPSALIVSRYAVSAQWLTGPLPVCLCVWNERPLPHLSASYKVRLQPTPSPHVCLSVCLSGGNLTPSICPLAGRSQLASCCSLFFSLLCWKQLSQHHVFCGSPAATSSEANDNQERRSKALLINWIKWSVIQQRRDGTMKFCCTRCRGKNSKNK